MVFNHGEVLSYCLSNAFVTNCSRAYKYFCSPLANTLTMNIFRYLSSEELLIFVENFERRKMRAAPSSHQLTPPLTS